MIRPPPRSPLFPYTPRSRSELAVAIAAEANVVAWTRAFVDRAASQASGAPARLHVKLDTGMGRLGTSDPAEATARSEDTRLNSSHANISYAVFCLKKKSKPT